MKTPLSPIAKAISLSLVALTCFSSLAENVTEKDGKSIYASTFFVQYNPQNALEMIERLPGFSFDQGSNERGFGGNAGNVLIDGARPTSKSGGLRGALIRIPAAQVERIEIIRGGIGAGEAAGQSIVANVVRSKTGSSGTWAMKLRQTDGANIEPNLEAAITTKLGDWDTSFDTDIGGWPGYRTAIFENRQGDDNSLRDSSKESYPERNRWAYVNGEGSTDLAGGKLALNGRIGGNDWRGDPTRLIFDARLPDDSAPEAFWRGNFRESNREFELGADWTKSFEQWKLRLIGLANVRTNEFDAYQNEGQIENGELMTAFNSLYASENTESEYIFRTTFSYDNGSSIKPEFGFELANNKLDTSQELYFDGVRFNDLQNAAVVVEEQRGEAFANLVWDSSDQLTVEGGLTIEYSEIQLTGDDNNKQNLTFYKPRLAATYRFDDDSSVTVEAQRTVGQLNFNDFAAGRDVNDESNTSGNSNLQPDKTNELSMTYDWSFSERGSLKVRAFHEWRRDILEHVRLGDDPNSVSYGVGNAGDARFWGIATDITLPLDGLLENGLIEINHVYRDSSFFDPIIGRDNTVSWYTPNWYKFELRQDLVEQKVTWGVTYLNHFLDTGYRVDEVQTFRGNNRWNLWIETTRYFDVKIRFDISNANTAQYTRTRYIYNDHCQFVAADPQTGEQVCVGQNIDRGDELVRIERSARFRDPELKLSISGTF